MKHFRLVPFLLTAIFMMCPDPSLSGQELEPALFAAIRTRNDRRVERLLREGTPARLQTEDGTTALMVAATWGTAETIERLLRHGADAGDANRHGVTALHRGVCDLAKARLLVDAGADVDARDAEGKTPLMLAASRPAGHEVVVLLTRHGADPGARDEEGNPVLRRAIQRASPATVKHLASLRSSKKSFEAYSDQDWKDLLRRAASRGDIEILETLHALLPDKNLVNLDEGGPLPIHAALLAQKPRVARWLMEHGARVDVTASDGDNSIHTLMMASFLDRGATSMVRTILDRGVPVDVRNGSGETPVTWARRRGNAELIRLLESAGVPDHRDTPPEIPNRELKIHVDERDEFIRIAAEKSIDLMLRSSDIFLEKRDGCDSCHHQSLPAIAAGLARDRGLRVDPAPLARLTHRTLKVLKKNVPRTLSLDRTLTSGSAWRTWALSALGYSRSHLTDALVRLKVHKQQSTGEWRQVATRPPLMGATSIQQTAVSIRMLRDYPVRGHEQLIERAVERAAGWLRDQKPDLHDQHVYRLLGLLWAGEDRSAWESDLKILLATQQPDGGWAQFEGLVADAWATGQALFALAASGALETGDPIYQRGVDFLLRTQFDDGSWFVQRRAIPFQAPFDSGFPFGKDQWISISGTAWAVMALVQAVEPEAPVTVPLSHLALLSTSTIEAPYGDRSEISAAQEDREEKAPLSTPKSLPREIHFERDVAPILSRSCLKCHSGTLPEGELDITRRGTLLKGGESGQPAIIPGQSAESYLLRVVTSRRQSLQMPPPEERDEFPALSEDQISILHTWIEQGAKWPEGAQVSK